MGGLHSEVVALIFLMLSVRSINTSPIQGDLRLVNNLGSTSSSGGRLEIYYNGEWGTVCNDGFGRTEANAACRQLGFNTATRRGTVLSLEYTPGSGKIWGNCLHSEDVALVCGIGNNCLHSEDVALVCGIGNSDINTGRYSYGPGAIAGIVIGTLATGCCIFFLYGYYHASCNSRRRRRRRGQENRRTVVPSQCTVVAIPELEPEDVPSAMQQSYKPQDSPAAYPSDSRLQTAPPPSYNDAIKSYSSPAVGSGAYPSPAMITEYPQPQISSQYPDSSLPSQDPGPVYSPTEPQGIPAPYSDAAGPPSRSMIPPPHTPQNLPPPDNSH